jgi:hypothetical protein
MHKPRCDHSATHPFREGREKDGAGSPLRSIKVLTRRRSHRATGETRTDHSHDLESRSLSFDPGAVLGARSAGLRGLRRCYWFERGPIVECSTYPNLSYASFSSSCWLESSPRI